MDVIEMNDLQIFKNEELGEVRVVTIEDEPWFVGKDVAELLGYSNISDALLSHVDEDDKRLIQKSENATFQIPNRGMTIINESGLYSLVLSSKLPTAKKFKRWITGEVLPSIRKHGAYMTPETLEAAILNPDTMIQLCTALKEEQDKRKVLEVANATLTVDNQIMKPKADYFDELVDRNLLTNFREAAKQLSVPPKKFVTFLLDHKYIYRDKKGKLQPYQQYVESGLFDIKECVNEKTGWGGTQTLITPKGRETFRLLMPASDTN